MRIELTQGKYAIVDDEDYMFLNKWKWCAHKKEELWYVERSTGIDGKYYTTYIHHLILGLPSKKEIIIDHINGDGLDNRKENLRICRNGQNQLNRKVNKNKITSKCRGVSFDKRSGFYRARITHKGQYYNLGIYKDEQDASDAYEKKAHELFGEFLRKI
jgi:hypothetical protein